MQSTLVVAGHTHIAAFAPPPGGLTAPIVVEADGASVLHGPEPREPAYWATFARAEPQAPHAIVWEGEQYARAMLIEPVPPIDFVLSAAPDLPLDPRASYVAEAHLRALFAPALAPLGEVIRGLRAAVPDMAIMIAGTPPPIGESDAIASRLANDPQFAPLIAPTAGGTAPVVTLSSPYTLQKVWSLTQLMLAEIAAANGATFVPVPDRTRTLEGFLAPAYWSDDPIHANAAFARELATDLKAAAEGANA